MPEGEVVTVLGPSEARLPKRRARPGLTTVERFVAVLSSLVDGDTAVAKVNFTKALEARSPATLLSRDKEVNNQRNLLIQNHRVAKSVHEILPLKYFGFSITSK